MQTSPRIAVIGGGLSGLTTAYRLYQKGYNVHVYEARNRVGGRIFSVLLNEHIAELGGQNIFDGGEAEHMLALINELGLETEMKRTILQLNYYENGEITNLKEIARSYHFHPEKLKIELNSAAENAQNMRDVLDLLFADHPMMHNACSTMLAGYEGASPEKLSTKYIVTLYHLLLGGLSSAHQNQESRETVYLNQLVVKGGNSRLAERLAELLSGHIALNHALQSIVLNSDASYQLNFNNGQSLTADVLILTLPCPVYQEVEIDEQIIPLQRQLNIQRLQYGTTAKILIPISPNQAKDGAYTNGRVVTFMNRDNNVLNAYYIKDYGYFSETSIDDLFAKDLPLFRACYGISPLSRPVIAIDQQFSCYRDPVGHSWLADPYAKGSYSCIGAGQEHLFTDITEFAEEKVKSLFAPIRNTLFFAGEHTSILLDVIGTMESAVESGERTARMVKNSLDARKAS